MSALSKTDIANLALNNLNSQQLIEDLDAEAGVTADTLRRWYSITLQQTLADFNWTFARTRLALADHAEAPPDEWAKRYQYPADCIKPRLIENPLGPDADPIPFDVEQASDGTRCILTDQDAAKLIYTRDETNTALFTPHFIVALALLWARRAAKPLGGNKDVIEQLRKDYAAAILVAGAHDGNTRVPRQRRDASWIRAREG